MNKTINQNTEGSQRFRRYLSPLAVWALSFGCSVGWGAFVLPGTTFLPVAGPAGTVIGMLIGTAIMFIIAVNYHYLTNRYPDAGGIFSFTKHVFGYDSGFLSSWFMGLVYLAIIWANATALPLVFRNLFGTMLQFGHLYTIAGYEVYLGEVMLSLLSLAVIGLVCIRGGKVCSVFMTVAALLLAGGIAVGFGLTFFRTGGSEPLSLTPAFSPDHTPALGSMFIMFLAPWAFAGFESVSHSSEEFKFPVKKSLVIMGISLLCSMAAYISLALIAASAHPEECTNWVEYMRHLGSFDGIRGMPVFHGISAAAGTPGLIILGIAAAAAIITGLLGNLIAASRMMCAMARDDFLPAGLGKLNKHDSPGNAILLLLLVSIPIPFLGRSAIGWVVDINTIGVTIAYAYTSAAAFREGDREHRPIPYATGLIGVLISAFFLVYFLVPSRWSVSQLATESYLMLLVWILLGFVIFRLIFKYDKARRIGKNVTIWIVMLLLVFASSIIWIVETTSVTNADAVADLTTMNSYQAAQHGYTMDMEEKQSVARELSARFNGVTGTIIRNTALMFSIILTALLIIFNIYSIVQKSHQAAVEEKTTAEQSSNAKTVFLSNMSHDIRTPMNAIIGYVTLAEREKDLPASTKEYLSKIGSSSEHLLAIINDVLEMSRIESGKMELMPIPTDLRKVMDEVQNLFSTQMETKGLTYTVEYGGVTNANVLCDKNRLNRVLQNLIGNAYKYTPKGGKVQVSLEQTGCEAETASYRIRVKDTGIGMSPEFAAKVFDAYERERTATVESIQGTGLGTAITKSIVDLMGGTISLKTKQGEGSEFTIEVSFPLDPDYAGTESHKADKGAASEFSGMRLLLVEDNPDNRDVEKVLFEDAGFIVDTAENGEDAMEAIAASAPGEYAAVIMDIEMPVKNGYDAARVIRSLKNPVLANVPIVALTAKAFSEDIAAARRAGMNAHIAKPINTETLRKTMEEVLFGK